MNILKQSTAATIKLGPFIDDTDGKTAETALTIAQADVRLSKNGGDFAQKNSTTSATHDEMVTMTSRWTPPILARWAGCKLL